MGNKEEEIVWYFNGMAWYFFLAFSCVLPSGNGFTIRKRKWYGTFLCLFLGNVIKWLYSNKEIVRSNGNDGGRENIMGRIGGDG